MFSKQSFIVKFNIPSNFYDSFISCVDYNNFILKCENNKNLQSAKVYAIIWKIRWNGKLLHTNILNEFIALYYFILMCA